MNAYHGSLIFKALVTYLLECGYTSNDLNLNSEENSSKDYIRMILLRKKQERLSERETVLKYKRPSTEG